MPAFLLDGIRNRRAEIVGGCPLDRLIAEAADAIERGFVEPVQQCREFLFGFAWEPDNKGRAQADVRTGSAPRANTVERLLLSGRPAHPSKHTRGGVLERDVEVRQ